MMTDPIVLAKALAAAKVNVRGTGKLEHSEPRAAEKANRTPNWNKWRLIRNLDPWQCAALWANIDPHELKYIADAWMAEGSIHRFKESQDFKDRLELVEENQYGALKSKGCPSGKVDLRVFAAWAREAQKEGWKAPAALLAMADEQVASAEEQSAGTTAAPPTNIFRTMTGLKWEEVSITFTEREAVRIKARQESKTFTYEAMGFKNNQSRMAKPNMVWNTLQALAIVTCTSKTLADTLPPQTEIKRRVSRLRDALQEFFGIQDDPISYGADGYAPVFSLGIEEHVISHLRGQTVTEPDDEDEEDIAAVMSRLPGR